MAKYKKVKRYHRSFYSPGMWAKKVVGIVVLVAVVLVVGWLAAPHVLDWATHTWYTVVRNRDLSASSGPAASSVAASSEAAAEPAASSPMPSLRAAGAFWTPLRPGMKLRCGLRRRSWPGRVRRMPS